MKPKIGILILMFAISVHRCKQAFQFNTLVFSFFFLWHLFSKPLPLWHLIYLQFQNPSFVGFLYYATFQCYLSNLKRLFKLIFEYEKKYRMLNLNLNTHCINIEWHNWSVLNWINFEHIYIVNSLQYFFLC